MSARPLAPDQSLQRRAAGPRLPVLLASMLVLTGAMLLQACTPRVELAASEPITINLNVKIEHEVRVKVEKDLENLFDQEEDIF